MNMTGSAGQKRVSESFLERLQVPILPRREQDKITDTLDRTDRFRRMRQYSVEMCDEVMPALFTQLFGEIFDSGGHFPNSQLGDVVNFIDYRGISPNKVNAGVRLVTARNIKRGHFELEPQEFIPTEEYEAWMSRGMPKVGDILFTTEGHTLGSAAKLPRFDKVALAQRLIALQPGDALKSEYLLQLILSREFQAEVLKHATGSAARGISSKNLGEISIPIPPKPLQSIFAHAFAHHERLRLIQIQALGQADHLFETLLHRAFGEAG